MTSILKGLSHEHRAAVEAIGSALDDVAGQGSGPRVDVVARGRRWLMVLDDWLLDDEQRQALSAGPLNLFFLHGAAFLCDPGAVDPAGPWPGSARVGGQIDPGPCCTGRLPEPARSRVRRLLAIPGVSDAEADRVLEDIGRWAGGDFSDHVPAGSHRTIVANGQTVDVLLIAACLRMACALDLDAETTAARVRRLLPSGAGLAPSQLEDRLTVDAIGPHPYFSGTIRMNIRCRHPEVHRALKRYERAVQRLLHRLNQAVRPRFLYADVIFEITAEGYEPVDLRFAVDSSAALQLFMGNRLYADKRVFLRELIQNAVDACSLRRLTDDAYVPDVSIAFNDNISVITVRDNGIGMDRQWVEKYFLPIGISFYQSDEIRDSDRQARIDVSFISQFGIGFLSSFLVSDKIVIKTRRADHPGLRITITSLEDYFDVRMLPPDHPVGTEVTLHLKASKTNLSRSMEYVGYLKSHVRFLKVPVRLLNQIGAASVIGDEPMRYDTADTADTDFVASLPFADARGYLLLRAKGHDAHIYALESAKGGISVFQDGIFVTQSTSLLPEGARQSVVGRINLTGKDKCELSMDRNRIFWTGDQLRRIKRGIRHGLVELANQLLARLQSQSPPADTFNSVVNHLAIFFDFSDVDDSMHGRLYEPVRTVVEKRFRDFVRIHFAHALRTAGIPEAEGYGERWQQEILASFVRGGRPGSGR